MMQDEFIGFLRQAETLFLQDELAILYLTSKGETIIRDKMVYLLQKHYQHLYPKIIVTREWIDNHSNSKERIDLAILKEQNSIDETKKSGPLYRPIVLCEFKIIHTDFIAKSTINKARGFKKDCESDLARIKFWSEKYNINCYFILLGIHQKNKINEKLDGVICTGVVYRNNFLDDNNEKIIINKCHKEINLFNNNRFLLDTGKLNAGKAYGSEVEIHFWVFSTDKN